MTRFAFSIAATDGAARTGTIAMRRGEIALDDHLADAARAAGDERDAAVEAEHLLEVHKLGSLKPLPFRGGIGVGAHSLAQGRWPPPAATKPASWQVSLPSPEGEGPK